MKTKFVYVYRKDLQRNLFPDGDELFQVGGSVYGVGHYYAVAENALEKGSALLGYVCGFNPKDVSPDLLILTRGTAIKGVPTCSECVRLLRELEYPVADVINFDVWVR